VVVPLADLRERAFKKCCCCGFTISKTYRTAWRWAFLNSLLSQLIEINSWFL
jgi:hypothetical protein